MASAAEAARLRLGARVAGKYRLARLIGVGGMGAVYEAEHAFTGKRVALKVLHAEMQSRKGFGERFLREAQSASKVGHPGIVDVYDAGEDGDGTLYLALELLQGEDLAQALSRGTVDVLALAHIAAELLSALGAAHRNGIVHRDLKPENVFLAQGADGTSRVKLLDFGIAKQLGSAEQMRLTATGTVLGTPYYMSPEQARGKEVDGRSDLWALGAVLFDALTGQPPFPGENYNEVLASILTDPIPSLATPRPELPADIIAVVDRALRRGLDERWQSADAMRDALETFLATRPSPDPAAQLRTTPRTADASASGVRDLASPDSTPVLQRSPGDARPTTVERLRRRWRQIVAAAVLATIVGALAIAGIVWASHRGDRVVRIVPVVTPAPVQPTAPVWAPVTSAPTGPLAPIDEPTRPAGALPPEGASPSVGTGTPHVGTGRPRTPRHDTGHVRPSGDTPRGDDTPHVRPEDPRRTYN